MTGTHGAYRGGGSFASDRLDAERVPLAVVVSVLFVVLVPAIGLLG